MKIDYSLYLVTDRSVMSSIAIEEGVEQAIFSTQTKADAKQVSIEKLQEIRKKIKIPIVVIGGIRKENAGRFRTMGVDGIAVVSAILARPDIRGAAAELKNCFACKE